MGISSSNSSTTLPVRNVPGKYKRLSSSKMILKNRNFFTIFTKNFFFWLKQIYKWMKRFVVVVVIVVDDDNDDDA